MNQGWIKLHRKILDSRVFSKPEILKLWIMCLSLANHEEGWAEVDGQMEPVRVERGQFVTGRYSLHSNYYRKKRKSNKSPITVWRWLEKLEQWGKVNIRTNNKYSVVEIINYDLYQSTEKAEQQNEQPNEHQLNNRRTSTEHQLNTNKNVNNDKNDKKNAREGLTTPEKIEQAETVQALSAIWFDVLKERNLWPTLSQQEMIRHQMSRWGLDKAKKIVSLATQNGWKSLKEDYLPDEEESEQKVFKPVVN